MSRRSWLVVAAAAVLLLAVLFQLPQATRAEGAAAESLSPIQRLLHGALSGIGDVFSSVTRAGELKRENDALHAELDRLRAAAAQQQDLEYENRQLREQLEYRQQHNEQQLVAATIIGREPDNLVHSITIDRGDSHGVHEGMSVVTPAGLVGRVLSSGPFTSKVLLITDSRSSVSGLVTSTRAQGVIYGRRQAQMTMRYLSQEEDVSNGQWVVTSDIGGGFPAGIPIGQIIHVQKRDVDTFQEATILPSVDFTRLEKVMVITSFRPGEQ